MCFNEIYRTSLSQNNSTMKRKILFSIVMAASITSYAQSDKKLTGYAITGPQKGQSNWKSVRLVDMATGEEIKTLYAPGTEEPEILNARTGKPIVKKDLEKPAPPAESRNVRVVIHSDKPGDAPKVYTYSNMEELRSSKTISELVPAPPAVSVTPSTRVKPAAPAATANPATKVTVEGTKINVVTTINGVTKTIIINRDQNEEHIVTSNRNQNEEHIVTRNVIVDNVRSKSIIIRKFHDAKRFEPNTDAPFATNSAALAYDKKHDRLYYTPMGIAQLRYIDLKSKTPKIYYFEDEPFGAVAGPWDVGNQITRMVIASDGNGYALSNNNEHLIRFTTGKKPVITDLGALTDDAANGEFTINSRRGHGGDMIADASGNLYLINANRKVYKISIETKVATYQGTIQGLPQGFSTNGAMVESGSKIIVCSAESTEGYFKVDLTTLQAEKVSNGDAVFNASDLANGNLAFDKKEDKKEEIMPVLAYQAKAVPAEVLSTDGIKMYPNPLVGSGRTVKLSFTNQPAGEYQIQLMELSGKVMSVRDVTINNKVQTIDFTLPQVLAKGSYLVKTVSDLNKVSVINKLIVE